MSGVFVDREMQRIFEKPYSVWSDWRRWRFYSQGFTTNISGDGYVYICVERGGVREGGLGLCI